jgi:hypothetical protein
VLPDFNANAALLSEPLKRDTRCGRPKRMSTSLLGKTRYLDAELLLLYTPLAPSNIPFVSY